MTVPDIFDILKHRYQRNAKTRKSTIFPERRELPAGVRQRKEEWELASERLSEIVLPVTDYVGERKVGADGARPLQRGGYKVWKHRECFGSVSDESTNQVRKPEWYRVRMMRRWFRKKVLLESEIFRLRQSISGCRRFFIPEKIS